MVGQFCIKSDQNTQDAAFPASNDGRLEGFKCLKLIVAGRVDSNNNNNNNILFREGVMEHLFTALSSCFNVIY